MIKPHLCFRHRVFWAWLLIIPTCAFPASEGYGLLWLDVEPSEASIALDGRYLDVGVWLVSLAPGTHDIAVRKPGFTTFSKRIEIASAESLHLEVHLLPAVEFLEAGRSPSP